jgi:hypothetical protein
LLANAYDGEEIKTCTEDFLKASNMQMEMRIKHDSLTIKFGGESDLFAYIRHNGLMDFRVKINFNNNIKEKKDVIILACYSKRFFSPQIEAANANPILWTTHLMAPEAYTLKSIIDG